MPISVDARTRRMSQAEFGDVAYRVMRRIFEVHNRMGRLFVEDVYRNAVAAGLDQARTEVRIEVRHGDFCKDYFIDLLVESGAAFELKAVESLTGRHRAQLLNYLLLAELPHGKLVNVRPELVEHEFVNTTLTRADRIRFSVDDADWDEPPADGPGLRDTLVAILRDWGTALEIPLYIEALTHFLGGEARVAREVDIVLNGSPIGRQPMRLAAPDTAFHITQITDLAGLDRFQDHARRLLHHTALRRLQWINVTLHQILFRTITRSIP